MSGCCRAGPCEQMFGARIARWDLRRYQSKGLGSLERRMLASVEGDLGGARVVEIGGGIGALQTELLLAGAGSGEVIELAPSYQPYARELAQSKGLADRTTFRVLDVIDRPDKVAPADVVVLNRVVCCSADGLELTATAAGLTRGTLVLSFPRDVRWLRLASRAQNATFRLLRRRFRSYIRPASAIVAAAESGGLRLVLRRHGVVWEYVVMRRPD